MNPFRSLLMAAFFAAVSVSCLKNDDPVLPEVEPKDTFTATTINTDYIYIGVRSGWIGWAKDSVKIKPLLTRITGEGKDPGFKKQKVSIPAPQQTLLFSDETASMTPAMLTNVYKYGTIENNSILLLRGVDTLTVPTDQNNPPQAFTKLGAITPQYHKIEVAAPDAESEYQIRMLPEQYAAIGVEALQFPIINYYLKTKDGWETHGRMNNFLNTQVFQQLATGDTLLIQLEAVNFK